MGASDKALGGIMLLTAAVVFTYYTTWAILLPFFDSANDIHSYFPAREWAIRLPLFVLIVGLTAIGFFVGSTVMKEKRKTAQRIRLRTA
ncbi:dolichol phosphate-mannose biosynthesis regulatory [Lentinula aciculospora]|uniref:Dolichol phosphate-mannose biosynthesis regulatory protein n=1 Tax=Lentinula aciculospora TaxID=153920 RepID=A0A9W9AST8_9AGAR|nr:dolichol phosphate-mannose biosynthesis regulatory [Lentinula aciculospora]